MADLGQALISKIIADDCLVPVMAAGIKINWFEDTEHRKAYEWMLEYHSSYSETPTEDALLHQFPSYKLRANVEEPLDYYIDRFRAQRERAILVDAVIDADTALKDDDPILAQQNLSKGLDQLGKEVNALVDTNAVIKRKSRFDQYVASRENAGRLTGITTGFPRLDTVSGGWHSEQFIIFGGSQKQGKSFMLMKSAIAAQDWGKKVLFISFEMSAFEQLVRYDAMRCGVDSGKLLRGALNSAEMKKLAYGMNHLKGLPPFIIATDISASTTLSGLSGKIEQHQPDIVFVDGVYLMENEVGAEVGSHQAYTSISRGLKRLAQRIKKPVIGTTQALPGKMKGNEVTMHSLGWTSAWSQDADLILGVQRVDDAPLIRINVAGGRNVSPCEMSVTCIWEESRFEDYNPDDNDDDDE